MSRVLTYIDAIREATDLCMAADPSVYVLGLGVPDPKGIFGSTIGLLEKYGADRVLDMPTSENGMTGVAIGSALAGMRPVMVHQRFDFALLAVEQIVNQAAKWHYMFGGRGRVPLVIRLIVGRGWGQGPQHSQSLHSWFAHIPGLKVVLPANAHDAKGLIVSSIEDDNPVIVIEHRWLHNTVGEVPEGMYRVPLGHARVARAGSDVTIAATSYMVVEALRAADLLAQSGIAAEVIDVRSARPLDRQTIVNSVVKTGRFIAADTSWQLAGMGAELLAVVAEDAFASLKRAPVRLGLVDSPIPTTPALSGLCYPRAQEIVAAACSMLGVSADEVLHLGDGSTPLLPLDVPDTTFAGPF
jgi:pyruvate dehydrogenase E1 component beta subunit